MYEPRFWRRLCKLWADAHEARLRNETGATYYEVRARAALYTALRREEREIDESAA